VNEAPSRRRSAATLGIVLVCYLGLSVLLWWQAWSGHPTDMASCGCNDPALFIWFLEWPAYAIAHGHNPLYSTALFHPAGINMLSNTGVVAIGVLLAPVTWLFGPVATLNVASTLGPALTGLAMFWLLRRYVRWTPAAFIGGLVFGFSPFVFVNSAVDHLNTSVLFTLPLIVACFDELLIRQRRPPWVPGACLGLLAAFQFFIGTEVLVIAGVCSIAGVSMVLVYAATSQRSELTERLPYAAKGIAVAFGVGIVLLAYPVWFALDGPAHLTGLVWPSIVPGTGGITPSDIWRLQYESASQVEFFAGYAGHALPEGAYLGLGVLVVLAAGVVVWWRDRRLWFFGGLGVVTVALCLSVGDGYWVPWQVFAHVPLIRNVIPLRIFAATTLCVGILLGIVCDRVYESVAGYVKRIATGRRAGDTWSRRSAMLIAATAAVVVAAVAIEPMATAISTNIPLTSEAVVLPAWFAGPGRHVPRGQVILVFPPPVTGASAMVWQAVDGMDYALATGGGPESIPARAGSERSGLDVITSGSEIFSPPAPATDQNIEAVRHAIAGWGVTMVVVPDPSVLVPHYDRDGPTSWAIGIFTLAIGRKPRFQSDAWVWSDVQSSGPRLSVPLHAFDLCTTGRLLSTRRPLAVPDCVTGASRVT